MDRSEEHTSELQSHVNLVCRLLLEKKKTPPSRATIPARIFVPPTSTPITRPSATRSSTVALKVCNRDAQRGYHSPPNVGSSRREAVSRLSRRPGQGQSPDDPSTHA